MDFLIFIAKIPWKYIFGYFIYLSRQLQVFNDCYSLVKENRQNIFSPTFVMLRLITFEVHKLATYLLYLTYFCESSFCISTDIVISFNSSILDQVGFTPNFECGAKIKQTEGI